MFTQRTWWFYNGEIISTLTIYIKNESLSIMIQNPYYLAFFFKLTFYNSWVSRHICCPIEGINLFGGSNLFPLWNKPLFFRAGNIPTSRKAILIGSKPFESHTFASTQVWKFHLILAKRLRSETKCENLFQFCLPSKTKKLLEDCTLPPISWKAVQNDPAVRTATTIHPTTRFKKKSLEWERQFSKWQRICIWGQPPPYKGVFCRSLSHKTTNSCYCLNS